MSDLLAFDAATGTWRPVLPAAGRPAVVWTPDAPAPDPAVADSWLLHDGRSRRLDLHLARFAASCAEAGADPGELDAALAALPAALPIEGAWFPRLDLRPGGALWLSLRPAPQRASTVTAWIHPGPDPRLMPRRKGPELGLLGALRVEAARHGAQEAVLADDDGRLLEGAYSSLLWWEEDTLCALPDDAPALPGITRRLLIDLAHDTRIPVRFARPRPDQLAGLEAWLVSALHGVRAVTAWVDGGPPAGSAVRAPAWQARLDAMMR